MSFEETAKKRLSEIKKKISNADNLIKITPFIYQMDMAFAIADVVISRAGAIAISELCAAGKPCILVPLPIAAEDHQKKNAQALVDKYSAIMVKDNELSDKLQDTTLNLLKDKDRQKELRKNILKIALPDAANKIADEVIKIMR